MEQTCSLPTRPTESMIMTTKAHDSVMAKLPGTGEPEFTFQSADPLTVKLPNGCEAEFALQKQNLTTGGHRNVVTTEWVNHELGITITHVCHVGDYRFDHGYESTIQVDDVIVRTWSLGHSTPEAAVVNVLDVARYYATELLHRVTDCTSKDTHDG